MEMVYRRMLYSLYGIRIALLDKEIKIHIEINTSSNHDDDSSLLPDRRKMTELRLCRQLIAGGLPLLLGINSLRTLRSIFCTTNSMGRPQGQELLPNNQQGGV